jgi:hypothetical protein
MYHKLRGFYSGQSASRCWNGSWSWSSRCVKSGECGAVSV